MTVFMIHVDQLTEGTERYSAVEECSGFLPSLRASTSNQPTDAVVAAGGGANHDELNLLGGSPRIYAWQGFQALQESRTISRFSAGPRNCSGQKARLEAINLKRPR